MTAGTVTAEVSAASQAVDVHGSSAQAWSMPAKIAFRFSFSYLMLYMFCNGNVTVFTILQPFPAVESWIAMVLFTPFSELTRWWAVKALHLTGIAATWHRDGSGDTLLNFLLCLTFLVVALLATALWSVLDRRRPHYRTLYAWLRFFVRLNVGMGMLQYGFYKVFPIQMQPPSMAVLNEPVGNMSPMTLLWTMLGFSPVYERVCGAAEVIGGLLILFRPTALAGAMVSAFVMTNVVLYNFFFDVPVKLYAVHVLLMACFVMLPDMKPLWDFFVTRRVTRQAGEWVPQSATLRGRRAWVWFEAVFLVAAVLGYIKFDGDRYRAYTDSVRPAPIIGLWRLDAGSQVPMTIGGVPWQEISIDNLTRGMARSPDGQLWRMYLTYDDKKHTLGMVSRGGSGAVKYAWEVPEPDRMILTTSGKAPMTLTFHKVATPASYPLMTRGFHLVNEWGLER
jgi:hypothetical protein